MKKLAKTILQIIKDYPLANLATVSKENKPWTRYVMIQASNDMSIRLATQLHSKKVQHIISNPEVHLTCGVIHPEKFDSYLQIEGKASVSTDPNEKKKFWCDDLNAYFKGPNDPDYAVIVVKPYRIEIYHADNFDKPCIWKA